MFGDGIMSAIDFTMQVEREVDPKGDRVKSHHVGQVSALQEMVIAASGTSTKIPQKWSIDADGRDK